MSRKLKHGWTPDLPDHRDKFYRMIKPAVDPLPVAVDLRPTCPPVVDQGKLGSCTANALAGGVEFADIKQAKAFVALSRLFIYYNERFIEGTVDQDSGAQIRDGIKSLNQMGVCPEELWPYDVETFTQDPPDRAFVVAYENRIVSYHRLETLEDMLTCLAEGFPFVFGFSVYEGFESEEVAKSGIVEMPKSGERMVGGHAVMAVGYDQASSRFIVRNSWGSEWGQEGYFTIPFEYLQTLADDFWTIRQ